MGAGAMLLLGILFLSPVAFCAKDMRVEHMQRFSKATSIFDVQPCVITPLEFVKAFLNRENRCVDNGLLVRLQSDNGRGGAPNARNMFALRLKARPVTFFSYDDTPAKYLRFGNPLDLGDFDEKPARGGDADGAFEGLQFLSNFLGMLEQIGYDSPSSYITGTYAMIIINRPPQLPLDNAFIPTWQNVVTYFSGYLAWVAGDPTFKLDQEIVAKLAGQSFGQLTGCPTSCTFEDLEFPTLPKSARPAVYGRRLNATYCTNPNTTRFVLTEPTGFDEWDASCSQMWKDAKAFADGLCTDGNNETVIKAFGVALVSKLKSLVTLDEKVMHFRAYLNTACGGTFNALFSGNGFTYTGTGGLMAPTGSEILLGAAPHLDMDNDISLLGEIEYIYFCSDGKFSQDPNFKCPTSA